MASGFYCINGFSAPLLIQLSVRTECLAMARLHLFNNIGSHLYVWAQHVLKRGYQVLAKLDFSSLLDFSTLLAPRPLPLYHKY
jgi:hypothetical protein